MLNDLDNRVAINIKMGRYRFTIGIDGPRWLEVR